MGIYPSLSSAPVLFPWCQRLHSPGPFESHPRGGLERLDREGTRMERGVRTWKGERETACYGRDGPFARRCSKRARKGEGGKLLELGIFTRPRLGQAKHVSPTHPPVSRFFRCWRHGIKSRGSRSAKLILTFLVLPFFSINPRAR